MSALPDELPSIKTGPVYDAEAYVFSAELEQPIRRVIEKEAFVELPESGGYRFKPAEPLRVEGIVSHRGGYTQVAGHRGCHGRGSTTLATAALEDVNVLDVLTADRVVAQITTEHPDDGSVPSVSFLGTRFENLRIGGEKIELEPHLDILGPKPDDDESYFNDGGVFSRIAHQYANIKRIAGLPKWASDQFNWDPAKAQRLNEINCSLVNGVSGSPGKTFGHVIELPHFGKIFLGELTVKREPANDGPRLEPSEAEEYKYRFQLTMIRVELDCPACGRIRFVTMDSNGTGGKGDGH
ncbi:MAG: choice-of-anchor P family protein [Candidatus Sulfotelmatobacter sp.]